MLSVRGLSKTDITTLFQKIAYMAEAKEWDNSLHVERIRYYVMILATGTGLAYNEAESLSLASMLHDIGKGLLSDDLLNRKGKFTPDEWKIVEQHTSHGKSLLEGSGSFLLQTAEAMAYAHHERWDGSGYPRKLKKQEIPFSARICAIADVFDALTTQRSYKKSLSTDEAYKLVVESSDKLFDPQIVEVFKSHFDEIEMIKKRFG